MQSKVNFLTRKLCSKWRHLLATYSYLTALSPMRERGTTASRNLLTRRHLALFRASSKSSAEPVQLYGVAARKVASDGRTYWILRSSERRTVFEFELLEGQQNRCFNSRPGPILTVEIPGLPVRSLASAEITSGRADLSEKKCSDFGWWFFGVASSVLQCFLVFLESYFRFSEQLQLEKNENSESVVITRIDSRFADNSECVLR